MFRKLGCSTQGGTAEETTTAVENEESALHGAGAKAHSLTKKNRSPVNKKLGVARYDWQKKKLNSKGGFKSRRPINNTVQREKRRGEWGDTRTAGDAGQTIPRFQNGSEKLDSTCNRNFWKNTLFGAEAGARRKRDKPDIPNLLTSIGRGRRKRTKAEKLGGWKIRLHKTISQKGP